MNNIIFFLKKFISYLIIYSVIILVFLIVLLFIIPPTPNRRDSLLFSKLQKDVLLRNVEQPRLIIVGGSNTSFGLDSEKFSQILGLNPINTGIHAGLGLKYMMDSTIPYIQQGDIIMLIPEYSHFFGNIENVSDTLLSMVFDVTKGKDIKLLSSKQKQSLFWGTPKFAFSRINPFGYIPRKSDVYSFRAFNKYGDVSAHWTLNKKDFPHAGLISGDYNSDMLIFIKEFEKKVNDKGGKLFISFPSYQAPSFDINTKQIQKVFEEIQQNDLALIGTPKRYRFGTEYFFDTSYHLTKKGIDLRMQLLIEDILQSSIFDEV